jgi:hypothetical protein
VFFCTDEGFGIEMVQALDEAHAVDIVQALQPGAVARAVPVASLEGKDRHRLLSHWMDALEQTMASEGGPAIPNPLTLALGCSEHQQQGLLPRQPDERRPGGWGRPGQREWWPWRGSRQDATTAPVAPGHPAERLFLSPPAARAWLPQGLSPRT